MKRVRERFGTSHPEDRTGISGVRMFDGEDLGYADRMKFLARQQKEWADQQVREKEERKKAEENDEREYADQTLAVTRMRGMLEDDSDQQRHDMYKRIQLENQRLAKEKAHKMKEKKKEELDQEYQEIAYSFVPYGETPDLPATFDEYAKTKGIISPAKMMKYDGP
eukprot:TRINITY_DN7362_c0_g1_i10.p1 TRINITY_DN7362_c0_g1~~TRINITY_DN7362_c0_g1_i10.p1  ORF type:complete len:166 (+),score=72.62 TRINITY_DN7362_c0_g1_i10:155-652(+)